MAEYFVRAGGVYPGFCVSVSEHFCCAGIGGHFRVVAYCFPLIFCLSIIVDTGVENCLE